jgi:quercetin dioxygenase-like cupin family protein
MGRKRVLALTVALVAAVVIIGGVVPLAAQVPPPPIATEILSGRAVFTDDVDLMFKIKRQGGGPTDVVKAQDPSRTVVGRFTVQPRAAFPWHTHAGPVVVNVVSGSLVYVPADDCSRLTYPAGTAFVDPGHGHIHSAFNPSTTDVTVFVATFFEAPAEGALLIPAEAPADCVVP